MKLTRRELIRMKLVWRKLICVKITLLLVVIGRIIARRICHIHWKININWCVWTLSMSTWNMMRRRRILGSKLIRTILRMLTVWIRRVHRLTFYVWITRSCWTLNYYWRSHAILGLPRRIVHPAIISHLTPTVFLSF